MKRRELGWLIGVSAAGLLTVAGCSDDGGTPVAKSDAGVDSGSVVSDSGAPATDSGSPAGDATAPAADAATDAATADAASADAGSPDAGPSSLDVFADDFAADAEWADFGGAANTWARDTADKRTGAASLRFNRSPDGTYYGGAIRVTAAGAAKNLSAYDALTFWAKADAAGNFDKAGFGNTADTGTLAYAVESGTLALTTTWRKFIVPIPDPAKLTATKGLFYFASGGGSTFPYTKVWFDDIKFEKLGDAITGGATATVAYSGATQALTTGGKSTVPGVVFKFNVNDGAYYTGTEKQYVVPAAGSGYVAWQSDNTAVATVDAKGEVTAVAPGTARITGGIRGRAASATQYTVNVSAPVQNFIMTFDDSSITYTLSPFGNEGAAVVADPTNASNKVAKLTKPTSAELWAGTTLSTGANNTIPALPFSATAKTMTVKVWSPDAGTVVKLKVEDATNGARSCETSKSTTVAGAWQTLTFDFANPDANTAALDVTATYNKISIFPGFGTTGAQQGAEKVYYVDDVKFGQ